MKEHIWHKGSPPHVGWWLASYGKLGSIWRWWDGVKWGNPVRDDSSSKRAFRISRQKDDPDDQDDMFWSDYYPKNARVPRIKP